MPNARTVSTLALALLALCLTPRAHAKEADQTDADQGNADLAAADVYLLSGQSNMAGSGQAAQLADSWQQPVDGAYMVRPDGIGALVAGKDGKSGRFGPELGFGHYLRNNQPGKPEVYLIKFALGGQPLDAGWGAANANGGGWAGPEPGPDRKTFYPGESPDDPNVGLHYQRLMKYTLACMQQLREQGHKPVLRGIVWMQGEADAKHEVSAGRYDRSLSRLKKRIEQDLGSGDVPFVFGQVLPHDPPLDRFVARDLIRQRMADADWRSGTKHAIDNAWMVSTDGMELLKDTVHYSTKGNLALGQAFGLEMLKAHRMAEDNTE